VKTPTPGDLLDFLRADGGWESTRDTKHGHYEKTLEDGTVLSTHVSFGKKKTVSPNTFKLILTTQLGVTEDEFWGTIRLRKSQRKALVLGEANKDPLTLALRRELTRRLRYTDEQMIGMTGSQAKKLLQKFHDQR
jgi:hypothetical protein